MQYRLYSGHAPANLAPPAKGRAMFIDEGRSDAV